MNKINIVQDGRVKENELELIKMEKGREKAVV